MISEFIPSEHIEEEMSHSGSRIGGGDWIDLHACLIVELDSFL